MILYPAPLLISFISFSDFFEDFTGFFHIDDDDVWE